MVVSLNIKKAMVICRSGHTDKVVLMLEGTSPSFPTMGYEPSLESDTEAGHGAQWVRENFGIEPEIIRGG